MENTKREGAGFVFALTHSKSNQAGADRADNFQPIVGHAAQALGPAARGADQDGTSFPGASGGGM